MTSEVHSRKAPIAHEGSINTAVTLNFTFSHIAIIRFSKRVNKWVVQSIRIVNSMSKYATNLRNMHISVITHCKSSCSTFYQRVAALRVKTNQRDSRFTNKSLMNRCFFFKKTHDPSVTFKSNELQLCVTP